MLEVREYTMNIWGNKQITYQSRYFVRDFVYQRFIISWSNVSSGVNRHLNQYYSRKIPESIRYKQKVCAKIVNLMPREYATAIFEKQRIYGVSLKNPFILYERFLFQTVRR